MRKPNPLVQLFQPGRKPAPAQGPKQGPTKAGPTIDAPKVRLKDLMGADVKDPGKKKASEAVGRQIEAERVKSRRLLPAQENQRKAQIIRMQTSATGRTIPGDVMAALNKVQQGKNLTDAERARMFDYAASINTRRSELDDPAARQAEQVDSEIYDKGLAGIQDSVSRGLQMMSRGMTRQVGALAMPYNNTGLDEEGFRISQDLAGQALLSLVPGMGVPRVLSEGLQAVQGGVDMASALSSQTMSPQERAGYGALGALGVVGGLSGVGRTANPPAPAKAVRMTESRALAKAEGDALLEATRKGLDDAATERLIAKKQAQVLAKGGFAEELPPVTFREPQRTPTAPKPLGSDTRFRPVEPDPLAAELPDLRFREPGVEFRPAPAKTSAIRVYHGSPYQISTDLDPSSAVETKGAVFFTTNPDVAENFRYPREYGQLNYDAAPGSLIEADVTLSNPLVLEGVDAQRFLDDVEYQGQIVAQAKAAGHDGVIARNAREGVGADMFDIADTYAVFDKRNIKTRGGLAKPRRAPSEATVSAPTPPPVSDKTKLEARIKELEDEASLIESNLAAGRYPPEQVEMFSAWAKENRAEVARIAPKADVREVLPTPVRAAVNAASDKRLREQVIPSLESMAAQAPDAAGRADVEAALGYAKNRLDSSMSEKIRKSTPPEDAQLDTWRQTIAQLQAQKAPAEVPGAKTKRGQQLLELARSGDTGQLARAVTPDDPQQIAQQTHLGGMSGGSFLSPLVEPGSRYRQPWHTYVLEEVKAGVISPEEAKEIFRLGSTQSVDYTVFGPTIDELAASGRLLRIKNGFFEQMRNWGLLDERGGYGKNGSQIATAIEQGKPVPAEVLADYPDLAAKYGAKSPPISKPSAQKAPAEGDALLEAARKGLDDAATERLIAKKQGQLLAKGGFAEELPPVQPIPDVQDPQLAPWKRTIEQLQSERAMPAAPEPAVTPRVEAPKRPPVMEAPKVEAPIPTGITRADRAVQADLLGTRKPVQIGGQPLKELEKQGAQALKDGADAEAVLKDLAGQGRAPKPEETAVIAAQRKALIDDLNTLNRQLDGDIPEADRTAAVALKDSLLERINAFDRDLDEVKGAAGRSLSALRIGQTVNWADLDEVLLEAKRLRGKDLAPKEVQRLTKEVRDYKALLAQAEKAGAGARRAKAEAVADSMFRPAARAKTAAQARQSREAATKRLGDLVGKAVNDGSAYANPVVPLARLVAASPEIAKELATIMRDLVVEYGIKTLDDLLPVVRQNVPGIDLTDQDVIDVLAGVYDQQVPRKASDWQGLRAQAKKAKGAQERAELAVGEARNKSLREKMRAAERDLGRVQKLENIERQLEAGVPDVKPTLKARVLSRQAEELDLKIKLAEKRLGALTRDKQQNFASKAIREGVGTIRMLRLGMDMGAFLRQGLFGLTQPKAYSKAVRAGFEALPSDQRLLRVESELYERRINGKLAEPIRRKAQLSRSDSLSDPEEAFIAQWFKRVPGLKVLTGTLERTQTAFLNTLRTEMFDSLVARFPDITEDELREWAAFINSATGRSELFTQLRVPEVFMNIMTSPRYEASRWEMIGQYAMSPVTAVRAIRNRAAREKIKALGATAGSIYMIVQLAAANGFETNVDPESSDFLKIRKGDTVVDLTAGLSPRIRSAAKIIGAFIRGDSNARQNPTTEIGKAVVRSIGPGVTVPYQAKTGETLSGFEVDEQERGWTMLAPLIIAGFVQTSQKEGTAPAVRNALAEFFGISVSRYPKPAPKPAPKPPKKKKERDYEAELRRLLGD